LSFLRPEAFLDALTIVFSLETLYWLIIGVLIGITVGVLPGLTSTSAIALFLPVTFFMDLGPALGLLIGLYKGGDFGGAISAIPFATPGTPAAAATVVDGHKLMQKKQGRKALGMSLYASFTADTSSDIITIIAAPLLAVVALSFGPPERFLLILAAFILIGFLAGRQVFKGLLSASLGVLLASIGTDPVGFTSRLTFGQWWLSSGIEIISLVIGLFAFAKMMEETVNLIVARKRSQSEKGNTINLASELLDKTKQEGLTFREFIRYWREILTGIGVGTFVGALPGLGSSAAAFLSYGVSKQFSKYRHEMGQGSLAGVAAAESGNSAAIGPTLIPLLALGIPGNVIAALIGGALMIKGITPSPRMFELFPSAIYAVLMILFLGNFVNLSVSRFILPLYAKIGQVPKPVLIPFVVILCIVGTYVTRGNPYDVLVMIIIGFLGYIMTLLRIPMFPLVMAFLLTPLMETSLRTALMITKGNWLALFVSPLAIGILVAIVLMSALVLWIRRRGNLEEEAG